jgi:hypothetical protein
MTTRDTLDACARERTTGARGVRCVMTLWSDSRGCLVIASRFMNRFMTRNAPDVARDAQQTR